MVTVTCQICGEEIESKSGRKKFCDDCARERHNEYNRRLRHSKVELYGDGRATKDKKYGEKATAIQKYYIQLWHENQGDSAGKIAEVLPLSKSAIRRIIKEGVPVMQRFKEAYNAAPPTVLFEIHRAYEKRLAKGKPKPQSKPTNKNNQPNNNTLEEDWQDDSHIVPTKRRARRTNGVAVLH